MLIASVAVFNLFICSSNKQILMKMKFEFAVLPDVFIQTLQM